MAIENLPRDPMMLLSFVNTRLRDDGVDFDDFCAQFGTERPVIEERLTALGYRYDKNLNRFV